MIRLALILAALAAPAAAQAPCFKLQTLAAALAEK